MGLVAVLQRFVDEKKRENDLKSVRFRFINTYTYIGASIFIIIKNVTRNADIQYSDVANEQLLSQSSEKSYLFEIPTFIAIREENLVAIKRLLKDELIRIYQVQSNADFNKKFKIDILNNQIILRML